MQKCTMWELETEVVYLPELVYLPYRKGHSKIRTEVWAKCGLVVLLIPSTSDDTGQINTGNLIMYYVMTPVTTTTTTAYYYYYILLLLLLYFFVLLYYHYCY